ncbi:MAG: Xaa-Pro peptidase family protein [Opitutae bacterium]|nr:Xaa-Pro peptidase family protein [Opitutae bacterium]MDG1300538.1 Xaa-Pro peptidase family protein [Opitutae bacterium]
MKSKSSVIRILYAASEQSADIFYLTKVFVPDPFLCFVVGNRSTAVVSRLEYSRVRAQSKCDEVLLLETVQEQVAKALRIERSAVGPAEMMRYFAKLNKASELEVPESFPSVYYAKLLEAGMTVRVGADPFFPARELKSDDEAKALKQGNAASAAGIRTAERVLRASKIVGNRLKYEGRTLTSEWLRMLIDQACLTKGAVAHNTIVAGGKQGCDPHEGGHGPLKPNELIIVDVFPRVQATGYHGDMTRTFLKGRANDAQRALVGAVRDAQLAALAKVKAGVSGATVHAAATQLFDDRGFLTERRGQGFVGFIHSTGHGLGLEVHESPRVSATAGRLRKGHVITIEPGLYYPELGGCRIEDVVRVTKEGNELLSPLHYRWELR